MTAYREVQIEQVEAHGILFLDIPLASQLDEQTL